MTDNRNEVYESEELLKDDGLTPKAKPCPSCGQPRAYNAPGCPSCGYVTTTGKILSLTSPWTITLLLIALSLAYCTAT